jgi:hypothetical protein
MDFNNIIGIKSKRDKMAYLLAKAEVENKNYPKKWYDFMISAEMESLKSLKDQELEIFFEAVFGIEELEKHE